MHVSGFALVTVRHFWPVTQGGDNSHPRVTLREKDSRRIKTYTALLALYAHDVKLSLYLLSNLQLVRLRFPG